MKLKLTLAASLMAMVSSLSAANYYVNNVVAGDNSDVLIENVDGSLLSGGIVAIGYFTGGAPSSSLADIATTISNFNLQASVLAGGFSGDLGAAVPGYYQGSIVNGTNILAGNPLIGQGVYLFAGNAPTLAGSTSWALVQIGSFIADNPPLINQYTADAAIAISNPSSIVFGKPDTANSEIANGHNTLQLVAVPEPSAALLGAIGVLGLLRRRRA